MSRKTTRTGLALPPQAGPLKRLVAVAALWPLRPVAPKLCVGGRPAQRRGGGTGSASRMCVNLAGFGVRASVWRAASSAPLWSDRPPVMRLPVAFTMSGLLARVAHPASRSIHAPLSFLLSPFSSLLSPFSSLPSALSGLRFHVSTLLRSYAPTLLRFNPHIPHLEVRPSQTFEIYERNPKPQNHP